MTAHRNSTKRRMQKACAGHILGFREQGRLAEACGRRPGRGCYGLPKDAETCGIHLIQWIGLREHLQEAMVFTPQNYGFRYWWCVALFDPTSPLVFPSIRSFARPFGYKAQIKCSKQTHQCTSYSWNTSWHLDNLQKQASAGPPFK